LCEERQKYLRRGQAESRTESAGRDRHTKTPLRIARRKRTIDRGGRGRNMILLWARKRGGGGRPILMKGSNHCGVRPAEDGMEGLWGPLEGTATVRERRQHGEVWGKTTKKGTQKHGHQADRERGLQTGVKGLRGWPGEQFNGRFIGN